MEDGMFLSSVFTRRIVSKIIQRALRKKLGTEVDLSLGQIRVTVDEKGTIHASVDADIWMDAESLVKLLKSNGLD